MLALTLFSCEVSLTLKIQAPLTNVVVSNLDFEENHSYIRRILLNEDHVLESLNNLPALRGVGAMGLIFEIHTWFKLQLDSTTRSKSTHSRLARSHGMKEIWDDIRPIFVQEPLVIQKLIRVVSALRRPGSPAKKMANNNLAYN